MPPEITDFYRLEWLEKRFDKFFVGKRTIKEDEQVELDHALGVFINLEELHGKVA